MSRSVLIGADGAVGKQTPPIQNGQSPDPLAPGEGWVRARSASPIGRSMNKRFDASPFLPSPRFARPLPEGEGCPHLHSVDPFIHTDTGFRGHLDHSHPRPHLLNVAMRRFAIELD